VALLQGKAFQPESVATPEPSAVKDGDACGVVPPTRTLVMTHTAPDRVLILKVGGTGVATMDSQAADSLGEGLGVGLAVNQHGACG